MNNNHKEILVKTKRHHHIRSHIKDRQKPHTPIMWDTTSPRAKNQPSPPINNHTPKISKCSGRKYFPPEDNNIKRTKRVCMGCEFECDRECIELHPNSLISLRKQLGI